MISAIEKKTDIIDERMSRMEEEGWFVDRKYYTELETQNKAERDKLQKKYDALIKKYNEAVKNGIDEDSEAARSMKQDIDDANLALEQNYTEWVKIQNQIRQLDWDKFDWLQERLEMINTEAEHFSNIFSHYKQVDELGNFTNEGWANFVMDYTQLEADTEALERYKEEYEKLQETYAEDKNDQEVISRMEDVQKKIFELEESSLDAVENMKSKLKDAFDANLAHLNETIDKYKEAMQDAKDLYSYQKNIENQTNNIMKLEKQMAAFRGDNSEEGRKKQVELSQKYKEAQEQLKETEWDRYISETGEMLDDMYSDYEKYLNEYLEDFEQIKLAVQKIATSDAAQNPLATAMATKISDFDKQETNLGKKLSSIGLSTQSISTAITNSIAELAKKMEEIANKELKSTNEKNSTNTEEDAVGLKKTNTNDSNKAKNEGKWEKTSKGTKYKDANGKYYKGGWFKIGDKEYEFDKNGYWTQQVRVSASELKTNLKEAKLATTSVAKMKKNIKLTALAGGSERITRAGVYETNEANTGSEFIYKTSYGGILTPLDAGDMVFTHEMSQRLWDIAANNVPAEANVQVVNVPSNITGGTYNTNADISITLPNVTNYDDFKKGLQKDDNFEKFIQEITVGRLNGNNSLNKRKY